MDLVPNTQNWDAFCLFSRSTVGSSHAPRTTLPGKEMRVFQKQVKDSPLTGWRSLQAFISSLPPLFLLIMKCALEPSPPTNMKWELRASDKIWSWFEFPNTQAFRPVVAAEANEKGRLPWIVGWGGGGGVRPAWSSLPPRVRLGQMWALLRTRAGAVCIQRGICVHNSFFLWSFKA